MNLTDWIGFIGVALLLAAYVLNLRNLIPKDGLTYLRLNALGAGMACTASVLLGYWPFIILEGCWTVVSLTGMVHHSRNNPS
jgi:hypothetical protein